jgi:molybdenum cofactor biosynthesis protein B
MINENIPFKQINISVVTISDTRNKDTDKSGAFLINAIKEKNHLCRDYEIINDKSLNQKIDVIITTGGTGLTGRDNTVHSIKSIAEIEIPGFGELFRQLSYQKIGTSTIQSLASAFLVNKTYVFCLPGSVSAVKDAWNDILFYQLDIRHKPCNFIELIPRLDE